MEKQKKPDNWIKTFVTLVNHAWTVRLSKYISRRMTELCS